MKLLIRRDNLFSKLDLPGKGGEAEQLDSNRSTLNQNGDSNIQVCLRAGVFLHEWDVGGR